LAQLLSLVDEAVHQPLVLVVDDDLDLCLNLWDIFRARGYRVSMAHDVQSVVQTMGSDGFQVVLIDMRLPDGDGCVVFDLVHKLENRPRTVLITGHRTELAPSLNLLLAAGADAVCYKPFNLEELFATVEKLSRMLKNSSSATK
jgi:DNA-binding response OmpR family regulator